MQGGCRSIFRAFRRPSRLPRTAPAKCVCMFKSIAFSTRAAHAILEVSILFLLSVFVTLPQELPEPFKQQF